MSAKTIFSVIAAVNFVGGVAVLLVPASFMSPLGVNLDAAGIHMARLNGACALGLAVILWSARELPRWESVRPVAIGTLVSFGVALIIAIAGTVSGAMNSLGWTNVALDALVMLSLSYLVFLRKAV